MEILGPAASHMPALIGSWGTTTYGELRELVEHAKKNLSRHSTPLLASHPTPDFIANLLAYLSEGVPVALVAPELSEGELAIRKNILQTKPHPECALIVFTSGSTGNPKAVQLSAANMEANIEAVIESLEFGLAPQQNLFLSLSYSYGLFGQLFPALRLGIVTKVLTKFADARAEFAEGRGAGMWSGVPSHWEALLRVTTPEQCDGVTHVISAGAALPLNLRERLKAHFRNAVIFNNYGLTEASPRVLSLSSRHPRFFEEDTVGFPVKFLKVREGEGGELEVKGWQVMLGYLGDEKETAEKLRDGWLRSGDVVHIDQDGMVHIVGRSDDLFNIGGERASPLEIDAALLHVPGVKEGAVLVEKHPIYGSQLIAFLVGENIPGKKELLEVLRRHLSGHKVPLEYRLVDALPRTPNGKLKRKGLVDMKEKSKKIV
ncbi:MAG: class I adenylate-forming enzyme family protein [Bdellovibrionota bacterium]